MQAIRIKRFSTASLIAALVLSVLFVVLSICGLRGLRVMESSTQQYIVCEKAARQLQQGSDVLTEQVRLYVMTGQSKYMDGYFEEANVTCSRESAVNALEQYFAGSQMLDDLNAALSGSRTLMTREIYAMRLAACALGAAPESLPPEVAAVSLTDEDAALSAPDMLERSRSLVNDDAYQSAKSDITENVSLCMAALVETTQTRQHDASAAFKRLYIGLEVGLLLLAALLLISSVIVRKLIVKPLDRYNSSIRQGKAVPVIGAAELRSLAETYNRVFEENQATQRLVRHEAEYDALTELLNRGSFNKTLPLYTQGAAPFALILLDIDRFKDVNDTRGHAAGDETLQATAEQFRRAFRSTDLVFRIGGDEFAVIMPGVSSALRPMVEEKLSLLRRSLAAIGGDSPTVTVSIGVAFSDDPAAPGDIFQNADQALYDVKERGKNGSRFWSDLT